MRAVRLPLLSAALAAALLMACSPAPAPEAEAGPSTAQETPSVIPGPSPEAVPAGPFAPPSFDCAQASGDVQKFLCTDQRLAELDREIDRLAKLAAADPALDDAGRRGLAARQADWIRDREDCPKSDLLRACLLRESVLRIQQLRQDHAHARSDDGGGISRGPTTWKCAGLDVPLLGVFVNGEPASMALAWRDRTAAAEARPDPDGVRYVGEGADGDVTFLVKGSAGMFVASGQPALSCEIERGG